jgi:hypothetical protein
MARCSVYKKHSGNLTFTFPLLGLEGKSRKRKRI